MNNIVYKSSHTEQRDQDPKTTLLIMAAGIGSRYGGGIKQLAPVGPNGEIIMDYSIHDAIEAGFNKIVFIIREDIEADFHEIIGSRIEKICAARGVEVVYRNQNLQEVPEGEKVPEGRTKPWGTGQAVLAARDVIHEPFVVINADDYYGKDAFRQIHRFLLEEAEEGRFCMAGFILKNTLSDNGTVTRGISKVDSAMNLIDIKETKNIRKITGDDGTVHASADGEPIDTESFVSMNMWGLTPGFMNTLEQGFTDFFRDSVPENPQKAEYLLPVLIGDLLKSHQVTVKVLPTEDIWFGVTYQEDLDYVVQCFREQIEAGVYAEDLFSDL